jgi:hypothetical protein
MCEACLLDYFFVNKTQTCEKCNCESSGVRTSFSLCDEVKIRLSASISIIIKFIFHLISERLNQKTQTGKCNCKENVMGERCDTCKLGYFNFSGANLAGCQKCDCDANATQSIPPDLTLCDIKSGQCQCKSEFVQGIRCNQCVDSMYNLEFGCTIQCDCDPFGSLGPVCDQFSGQCRCKPKIGGLKCNICQPGYFNLTQFGCVSQCACSETGSLNQFCSSLTGQCPCREGYTGRDCGKCQSGYWLSDSKCIKCVCNLNGILDNNNICEQVENNFQFYFVLNKFLLK